MQASGASLDSEANLLLPKAGLVTVLLKNLDTYCSRLQNTFLLFALFLCLKIRKEKTKKRKLAEARSA